MNSRGVSEAYDRVGIDTILVVHQDLLTLPYGSKMIHLRDVPEDDRRLHLARLMISAMSNSFYLVPDNASASTPSALTTEQEFLADSVRDEVQVFLGSPAANIHEAAVSRPQP